MRDPDCRSRNGLQSSSAQSDTARWTSIEEKIRDAHTLHEYWGSVLHADAGVRIVLERLHSCVETSRKAMHALGVSDQCRQCEELRGGSCCGQGIEDRYTKVLLLVNLLLGVSLPEKRFYHDSCYFLGPEGCVLKVRLVLCVNYLCSMLQKGLSHDSLIALQQVLGDEMETAFLLEEAIKNIMSR